MKHNSIFVYGEIAEEGHLQEVSLELLSKGRSLADQLRVDLEMVVLGSQLNGIPEEVKGFGVNYLHLFEDARLFPYTTLPHAKVLTGRS
jgi:electron transfer flavoprotein alpha subunit